MDLLLQRNWFILARLEENGLISEAVYNGTDREIVARLLVDAKHFRVLGASWEVYRAPGLTLPLRREIEELYGLVAYFGCGEEFRRALSFLNDPFAAALFSESVRGIIQAETFLYKERGFPSSAVFEKDWVENYIGGCRYYSNLDRVTREWFEYIGYDKRTDNLFNRTKTQVLFRSEGQNTYRISSHLHDSFHGMALETVLDQDFTVRDISGMLLRAPDAVCKESASYLPELIGCNLNSLKRKDIYAKLGGAQGCVHFIEIAADGADTLKLYLSETGIEKRGF